MKKIEKVISRDLSLIDIYAWHRGYTIGMKEWLGWSYSDSIFYMHDGFVDIMRLPEEHLKIFRDKGLEKIQSNKKWFFRANNDFQSLIKKIYDFYDKNKKQINRCSKKELKSIYNKYVDYIEKVMGPFIFVMWFPIWSENNSGIAEKYEVEIKMMIESRILSEHIFPKGHELITSILDRIQKDLDFTSQEMEFISQDEFLRYIDSQIIPNRDTIEKRISGLVYSNAGVTLVQNKNISKVFSDLGFKYDIENYENIKELKGVSACKGKVVGEVMIIMEKVKISAMKENGILVTSMTTPEYVPAMRKASAFITDEGGITSHAAIVSRELKKPCIIGTKIATKVLKDGMRVEVDADRGIVTVLE